MAHFFRVCDGEALRQAPDRAAELGRRLKDWAVHGGRPLAAVAPLRTGIAKLRPSPECLTPLHADLFQVRAGSRQQPRQAAPCPLVAERREGGWGLRVRT